VSSVNSKSSIVPRLSATLASAFYSINAGPCMLSSGIDAVVAELLSDDLTWIVRIGILARAASLLDQLGDLLELARARYLQKLEKGCLNRGQDDASLGHSFQGCPVVQLLPGGHDVNANLHLEIMGQ